MPSWDRNWIRPRPGTLRGGASDCPYPQKPSKSGFGAGSAAAENRNGQMPAHSQLFLQKRKPFPGISAFFASASLPRRCAPEACARLPLGPFCHTEAPPRKAHRAMPRGGAFPRLPAFSGAFGPPSGRPGGGQALKAVFGRAFRRTKNGKAEYPPMSGFIMEEEAFDFPGERRPAHRRTPAACTCP